jgi:hypothetical protein
MNRYFKATDGRFTVYRSSATRVYASAWFAVTDAGVRDIGFSAKPHCARGTEHGAPAVEISKAEYQTLVARKAERIAAFIAARAAAGNPVYRGYDGAAPSDSWVFNEALA